MPSLLIALLLAAAPSSHRAKAERAEALGHMQDAAREYETAWQEEQAPELLYRLGIVRRKLKQYGKAREAFRAYLREAPEGGLRDEVERQLAKLDVLIEAQSEDYSDEPPLRKAPPRAPPAVQPPPPPVQPVQPAQPVPSPVAPPAGEQRSPAPREQVNSVHQPEPAPERATVPAAAVVPAPIAPVVRARAAPWLAAGAAVTAAAGAYLWWDGARLSRDLDARYASGDLTTSDRPSYSRAHTESLAGRLLVAAAAGLIAGAVVLW